MRIFLCLLLLMMTGSCSYQSAAPDLPEFKLPAPKPSVRSNLPRSLFGNPATVGDVASKLLSALQRGGYEDFGYYRVPDGFALVTETERIHDDGKPYEGSQRWSFEPAPLLSLGSLFDEKFPGSFVKRLRNADPGRYRVLVFLVTTAVVTTGSNAADFDDAESWTEGGGDFLPRHIAEQPLTADQNISVLVYEFRRASVAAEPEFVNPSGLTARRHLQATSVIGG